MENKKDLPGNIEQLPDVSPLLNDEIVEKDYTQGIEEIEPEKPPKEQVGEKEKPTEKPEQEKQKVEDYDIDTEKVKDETESFTFEKHREEPTEGKKEEEKPPEDEGVTSDVGASDSYQMPEGSAREFAEMIGEAFSIYVPQFSYEFCKIDLSNIKFHINQGNIKPEFEPVFRDCNRNTEESLKFSREEMTMFKKSLQKYLEYKNVTYANPETAFWANVAILGTKQMYITNKLIKENRKLVFDVIKSTNPDFSMKKEKEKKEKDKDKDKKKDKKKEEKKEESKDKK